MKKWIVILLIALMGCSSTELVENWKNPDIVLFNADKVLLVGMTQNMEAREEYETKLHKEFKERGVEAMRSIDLFDVEFTSSERSEEELARVQQQLLDKGFDAILFTKVVGMENIESFRKSMANLDEYYGGFEEDYLQHQNIYYDSEYYDDYSIYHTETSLYCICIEKERELIWRGSIDISDPIDAKKTINDYIKLVVLAMEEQDLIFRNETKNESAKGTLIL